MYLSFDPALSLNVPQLLLADAAAASGLKHNRQRSFLNGQAGHPLWHLKTVLFKEDLAEKHEDICV